MNKHERIKRINTNSIERVELIKYVEQAEATEKELEEIKQDVKRYFEIKTSCPQGISIDDWKEERELLEQKLSKVGEK